MTDDGNIMSYDIHCNDGDHTITTHLIDCYELPAMNMNSPDCENKQLNSVFIDPINGISYVGLPYDLLTTFNMMNMINVGGVNSIRFLGILEIDIEDIKIWATYNTDMNSYLAYPMIKIGYIQQTICADDMEPMNTLCRGPCLISAPNFGPLGLCDMDKIVRSIKFVKKGISNPTFCLDLKLLYMNINRNGSEDEC